MTEQKDTEAVKDNNIDILIHQSELFCCVTDLYASLTGFDTCLFDVWTDEHALCTPVCTTLNVHTRCTQCVAVQQGHKVTELWIALINSNSPFGNAIGIHIKMAFHLLTRLAI